MKIVRTRGGTQLVVQERVVETFGASHASYIGGTDLAPILGVSEKRTRFAVWAAKVRADVKEDDSLEEEASAGQYYEPFILRRFAKKFNVGVVPTALTFRLKAVPFLAANPDGLVYPHAHIGTSLKDALGVVDAKTRSPFQRGRWGDTGTANVPPDEMCQVQWYCEILDLPVAYLAVFFDRTLHVFVVPRDRELGAMMIEEATAFWNEYVIPKKEPPFEGAAANDYLRRKYPHATEPLREAELDDDLLIERQILLKKQIAALETNLEAVEGSLKNRIGDAEGIQGRGYKASWYDIAGRNSVEWKAVVAELRSFPVVADEETARQIREQIDSAIARYTKQSVPSRALKVTLKGPRLIVSAQAELVPTAELISATPAALPPATTEGE